MMNIINTIFGIPLGYLMYGAYQLVSNYGLSIILFTLLTKVVMFPLSLVSQKNSIKMVKMKPMLEEIKQRNAGFPELILSEQKKLYKKEKYNSSIGILPLLIQVPIVLGLINVVYNPLQHLIRLDGATIQTLADKASQILGQAIHGSGAQIQIMHTIQSQPGAFAELLAPDRLEAIRAMSFQFMGLDLSVVPTWTVMLIIPVLSGLSSLLLSVLQNRYNVLQREQGPVAQWAMAIFLVAFSGYFAFLVPAGIGLYWVAGNLLSIPVLFICNAIYDARKYIDYENRTQKPKLTKEEKQAAREQKRKAKALERESVKRFFSGPKKLVFYSESNGFYKYFGSIMDDILAHSALDIHYITGDPNDKIFNHPNPRVHAYYVGNNKLISVMMRMDADMVVMTMPDLDQYHIKRSIVRKDVEYVYLDHGMTSYHLMLREHALDAYDTIMVYGPNHIQEVRETEKAYGLKPKKLVETGYALLDDLLLSVSKLPQVENDPRRILIAPSWQKDNLLEYCLEGLMEQLFKTGYHITIRPHPEFVKRFPGKMKAIQDRYHDKLGDNFVIETDFSANSSVYQADLVVTDWSSIAQEFSYATKKPSVFINTPMKVMNPNYQRIPCVPLDISLRDEIGVSVDVDDFEKIPAIIDDLMTRRAYYHDKLTKVLNDNIFHIGEAARMAGTYIIGQLGDKEPSTPAVDPGMAAGADQAGH